jgi:hypothetical protein
MMLITGDSNEAGDHKDQSASPPEHPEPMQRARFEIADGSQHAAAGTGVSMDAIAKLSALRMKSRSFRSDDDEERCAVGATMHNSA